MSVGNSVRHRSLDQGQRDGSASGWWIDWTLPLTGVLVDVQTGSHPGAFWCRGVSVPEKSFGIAIPPTSQIHDPTLSEGGKRPPNRGL